MFSDSDDTQVCSPCAPDRTPMEPGVDIESTVLPTVIADLDRSRYTGEDVQYLAGWVSPNGYYYQVLCLGGHSTLSGKITNSFCGNRRLECSGWVHLHMNGYPELVSPHRLTKKQIDALTDLCLLCEGTSFASMIMNKIENSSL